MPEDPRITPEMLATAGQRLALRKALIQWGLIALFVFAVALSVFAR